jgi:hypothetical protein
VNKTVPPDTIVDVRVRLPNGMRVDTVTAKSTGPDTGTHHLIPIISYHKPPDPKPTFEAGKSYRMSDGRTAGPLENSRVQHVGYPARYPLCAMVGGWLMSWTAEGSWTLCGPSQNDLLPGAIEDEKAVDPICVLQGQIDALSENQERLLDRINSMERARSVAMGVSDKMSTKLDAHDEAIEKGFDVRISVLEHKAASLEDRLDRHAIEISSKVNARTEPPKRTIKGGWLNVYPAGAGFYLYPTREEADLRASSRRVACIMFPDITEGEGLCPGLRVTASRPNPNESSK